MMNWTKVETGEPRRDGSSRSRNWTVKERESPSSATYSWASAIALVVTSTGTGPLVVMETSSPSRTRPAIAPASLKQSVLSLTVRSSSDGSRSMISEARCSSYETFEDWRMSCAAAGGGGGGEASGDALPEGDAGGEGRGSSNGAGKTTLAMAPLWALTGSTDARANGKPVEARGVISEGASRAVVSLRGEVSCGVLQGGDGEGGGGEGGEGGSMEPQVRVRHITTWG
mmetsp:Transcript_36624/g.118107  ORF Transcript_36624/g.118107 Transcript_36624/m.118107 type:complete len:228 (-) Transcript_36624:1139-1822(-)